MKENMISHYATLAGPRKTYSKQVMRGKVRKLLEYGPDQLTTKEHDFIFADLYNFFLATEKPKIKDLDSWIACAAATDDIRLALNYIYVDKDNGDNRTVATDGHRLHMHYSAKGRSPGHYTKQLDKVRKNSTSLNIPEYPNYKRVSEPDCNVYSFVEKTKAQIMQGKRDLLNRCETIMYRDAYFNLKYMQEALALADDDDVLIVFFKDNRSQIMIDDKKRKTRAVIMPMRGD